MIRFDNYHRHHKDTPVHIDLLLKTLTVSLGPDYNTLIHASHLLPSYVPV